MPAFGGFPAGKVRLTPIPAQFFTELLPEIDDMGELKVSLYALWYLDRQEGTVRYITYADFAADELLMGAFGKGRAAEAALQDALERAVRRGTLLCARLEGGRVEEAVYFLNSPKGRAALQAMQAGKWTPDGTARVPVELDLEQPTIFRLYEENIGPLTPMIADVLREAEQNYPPEWIPDAIQIAVENNIRRWRYIEAILRSWKEKGRHGPDRRDSEEDRKRYVTGDFADFIEH